MYVFFCFFFIYASDVFCIFYSVTGKTAGIMLHTHQFYGATNLLWDWVQHLSSKSWTEMNRAPKARHDNKRENTCEPCDLFVSVFLFNAVLSFLSRLVYLAQMAEWCWQHFIPVVKINALWSYSEMKTCCCVVSGGSPHERIPLDFQSRDANL